MRILLVDNSKPEFSVFTPKLQQLLQEYGYVHSCNNRSETIDALNVRWDGIVFYLRGDQKRVVNNKQYMEVFSLVVHQCDVEDKNAQLHAYYEETCVKYIQKELRPFLVN